MLLAVIKKTCDKKYLITSNIIFLVLLFGLTSCGGGASSGGEGSDQNSAPLASDIENITLAAEKFRNEYVGLESSQVLIRQNTLQYVSEIQKVLPSLYHLYSDLALDVYFFDEYKDIVRNGCNLGNISESSTRNNGNITLTRQYENCAYLNLTLSGVVTVNTDESTGDSVIYFEDLVVASEYDLLSFSGIITKSNRTALIKSLLVKSTELNQVSYFSDINYRWSGISGRVYIDDLGYVDFDVREENRHFVLQGDDDSSVHIDLFYTEENEVRVEQYSLSLFDQELQENLENTIPVERVASIPYLEQSLPVPVVNTGEDDAERLSVKTISSIGSIDSNFDFLSFSWRLLSVPGDCQIYVEKITTVEAEFYSNCQGLYEVELTAFDGYGYASSSAQINVLPLPAQFEVTSLFQFSGDKAVDIPISILNAAEDGPFDLHLTYAPEGVSINDGAITGSPESFIQSEGGYYFFGVRASNGRDSNTEIAAAINEEQDSRKLLTHFQYDLLPQQVWRDIDGDGNANLLVPFGGTYKILELRQNDIVTDYIEHSPPRREGLVSLAQYDVNLDGVDDIVLGYESEIFAIDGGSKNILFSKSIPVDTKEVYYREYEIYPIAGGFKGVFFTVWGGDGEGSYLMGFEDDVETKYLPVFENVKIVSDLDGDSIPEFVSENSRGYWDFDEGEIEVASGIDYLEDLDGDSQLDFIIVREPSPQNPGVFLISVASLQSHEIEASFEFSHPTPEEEVWGGELVFANLDEDPEVEVVLYFESHSAIYVFDKVGVEYQLDVVELPESAYEYIALISRVDDGELLLRLGSMESIFHRYSRISGLQAYSVLEATGSSFSQPYLQEDGSINLYYEDYYSWYDMSNINFTNLGDVNHIEKYEGAYSASGWKYFHEIEDSSLNRSLIISNSSGGYSIYDVNSENVVFDADAFSSTLGDVEELLMGDIDGDGLHDIFSLSADETSLVWFLPFENQLNWSLLGAGNFSTYSHMGEVYDLDNDGVDELVVIARENGTANYEIQIYNFFEGFLVLTNSLPIEFSRATELFRREMAFQDVDADGRLEVIVTSKRSGCSNDYPHPVFIIEDDLSSYNVVSSDTCIKSISSINTESPKRNILVSSYMTPSLGEAWVRGNSYVYSQFVEIDMSNGDEVWRSKPFIGNVESKEILVFGGGEGASVKGVGFDSGFYLFH